jgi:4-phytase/acid phosphatase
MRPALSAGWRFLSSHGLVVILALSAGLRGPLVPLARGDELKLAIILTRHGVRSPLESNESLSAYAAQPWPTWETPPGVQTPHGNQLIALMGDYYRERFMRSGLLTGDPAVDGPLVYIRADNDQRTLATATILGKALVPIGEPMVHAPPEGEGDPLFRAYRDHVGHANVDLAAASVLGRLGGNPANLEHAYAAQLGELDSILYGPGMTPPAGSPLGKPTTVSAGSQKYVVSLKGRFQAALQCSDALILEYADGKPMQDVGWGRFDESKIMDILTLNVVYFDLANRTLYPAQVEGLNLASHIVDTLEQAAGTESVPGALGPQGEHLVLLVGHDSDIAYIGGMFGMNWLIPGAPMNPTLPGGALLFELWKKGDGAGAYYVRTSYVSQTLKQDREATLLSLDNPPSRSPIFIPGCGGIVPDFDAPLGSFIRQARKVIDPAFIAPEQSPDPDVSSDPDK